MLSHLTTIRGGYRALALINHFNKRRTPIRHVRLEDGSDFKLDLRSQTEWPTFYSKRYDDKIVRLVTDITLNLGGNHLDIGANIGFYAVRVAKRLRADSQTVYAFEPVPANAKRLWENMRLTYLTNMTIYEVALSDSNGIADVVLREDLERGGGTGNASLAISEDADGWFTKVQVTLRRLDDIITEDHIETVTTIKIDVEGHEDLCFRGAQELLHRDQPVIFSEINN